MPGTLRARITATCVAIVVGALCCSGFVSYTINARVDEATLKQNLRTIAEGNAQALDEWVASRSLALEAFSVDSLTDPLRSLKQLEASGGFALAYVGLPDKHAAVFSHDVGMPPNYDPTTGSWYPEAVAAGKLFVPTPYTDIMSKKLVLTFERPILDGGQVKAVVAADINLDRVDAIVSGIQPSPASFAFIVDDRGVIISHPEARFDLKPATTLSAALTQTALSGLSASHDPFEAQIGGRAKLLQGEPIAGTNWKLVVALDKEDAMTGLHNSVSATLVTALVIALIAGLIVSVATGSAFRRLSAVRAAMDDIGSGDGDLATRLPVHGRDEVAQIALSFNRFADKLSRVLREIRTTSDSVKVAAAEISHGNRDLSARTEQAAASLEETAGTMEELAGTMRNAADAATRAGEMAQRASSVAQQGGAVVADVVSTMDEIAVASSRIQDIIGVIDGIAFQTNILALNAAVEAARAGQQGRGFAVVAGEVRALALRSAEAARQIKDLITDSVNRVDAGTQLVQRAGTTMTDIVANVQKVTTTLTEISAAAAEQSAGILQVNQAVAQLDNATQRNAALVEQATGASDLLHEQASRLAEVVNQFQLG
ncbi:methyl-accepting chemotaxis protein [Paraburkholderia sp. DHOC27]|uniref:methyl-accepting chemotaxis protein n=1 Tax=Paraburkholderia sp. DHOC27 TaxID=2303330 RepID=UPI000E3E8B7E|nr:methyl-accepting chemotaxis protein [Paraburkholderia sp. DHOC27]RFU48868.1 methyl-accepting chemotaxis protein [Paraburkholderia sp. DHOC27]